jgi:hypothetical protein
MRTQIFINNEELDLIKDIDAEFTFAIDDIADFGSKNTSFSKTINIAGSAQNNKVFGFIFDLGNSNFTNDANPNVGYDFNASKVAPCRIFVDGIQIFKGVLRLMEVVITGAAIEYQCSVYGDLGGFISALGNKRLEDLDFSEYDQDWTLANITASWDNINASGVYFPLIDYGNVTSNNTDFSFKAFKPALYVKEYLKKIQEDSGYTWDFPLLDTNLLKRMVIPSNKAVISNPSTNAFIATADEKSYSTENYPDFTVTTAGDFTLVGNSYRYNGATALPCTIALELSGEITDVYPAPPQDVTISLRVNSGEVASQTYPIYATPNGFYVYLEYTTTLNQNDTIDAWVSTTANTYDIDSGFLKVFASSGADITVNYGEDLLINNAIPKGVFQRDFFLSICKMFNLYVYDDQYDTNKIKIKPYIDFYDGSFVDWSNKIDRSKPISIKPMSEINARYYQFKYKQDNDYYNENYRKKYNEGYGDLIYDTEFDFVKDTDASEVIFAASVLFQAEDKDKVYPAIYKKSDNNSKTDPMDSVIRILQAKKITGRTSYKIQNGGTDLATLTVYGYAGHLDDPFSPTNDINFGAPKEVYFETTTYPTTNLFNAYYSDYMAEITDKDSKLLTCNILLNAADVLNLNFGKLVMIDNQLFRINKIEGYNSIDYNTSKIELLKVITKVF